VLETLRREIDRVMGLMGAARLDDIGADLLYRGAARHER
jgi:isopentenyl diphosphate isomerase/L-lactate dehydrogenase-like FMN-dependent dehydrogenase